MYKCGMQCLLSVFKNKFIDFIHCRFMKIFSNNTMIIITVIHNEWRHKETMYYVCSVNSFDYATSNTTFVIRGIKPKVKLEFANVILPYSWYRSWLYSLTEIIVAQKTSFLLKFCEPISSQPHNINEHI